MRILKVCVIDEAISLNVLGELVRFQSCNAEYAHSPMQFKLNKKSRMHAPCKISVIQRENTQEKLHRISHGTLCTALLIESLEQYKITEQVEVSHFSISNNCGDKSFMAVLEALEYCMSHRMDLVSMSIGMLSQARTKDLIPVLQGLKGTVVAAASNHFALTYPAAMPQVIGVKRSIDCSGNRIQRISNPPDGIEIIADLPQTEIMKQFYKRCNLAYRKSNSELAPQLCGKIAARVLAYSDTNNKIDLRQNTGILTKEYVLKRLKISPRDRTVEDYQHIIPKREDDQVPAVVLPYNDSGTVQALKLAIELQQEFEASEYSCAVLGEMISDSDFVEGRFQLDMGNMEKCLNYYLNAISEGLLLVLLRRDWTLKSDLRIDDWQSLIRQGGISKLKDDILNQFSQ